MLTEHESSGGLVTVPTCGANAQAEDSEVNLCEVDQKDVVVLPVVTLLFTLVLSRLSAQETYEYEMSDWSILASTTTVWSRNASDVFCEEYKTS